MVEFCHLEPELSGCNKEVAAFNRVKKLVAVIERGGCIG